MTYDEFRVLVQPDLVNGEQWAVHVQKCPRPMFVGPQGTVAPRVTAAQLQWLRNATAPQDLAALKELGKAVVGSILPANALAGLQVCADDALQGGRGLRLVVTFIGKVRPPGGIGAHELPVEAAFTDALSFMATNARTPVSRGINAEADRDPVRLFSPLKILVVASEPSDMPPVHAAEEKQAMAAELKPLVDAGAVAIEVCDPPTRMELNARLQRDRYHVVHFIGHGDFDSVGLDPTPQPHLYFEDGTPSRESQASDLEQLFTSIRNGNVPLVVLTACASAASQPRGNEYPAIAFESLAQGLVERPLGPLAVVAMQYDLESNAAQVFAGSFYRNLLVNERSIDEALSMARSDLQSKFGAAHRSWVNPTVYWRCKGGGVFQIMDTAAELTPQQKARIGQIDAMVEQLELFLKSLGAQPQALIDMTATLRSEWQSRMSALLDERALITGETIRLRGGSLSETVECALTIQLRAGARVGDVRVTLGHDPAMFDVVSIAAGDDVPANAVLQGAGGLVVVQNASGNAQWPAGEYRLAKVRYRVKQETASPVLRIPLAAAQVSKDGNPLQPMTFLNAVVFRA